MLTRRVFFAVATLAATFGFNTPSHADALADITARGTLRVAVPQDFPPFGSVGTNARLRKVKCFTRQGTGRSQRSSGVIWPSARFATIRYSERTDNKNSSIYLALVSTYRQVFRY